jgi:DNA-binding transcriptional regulator GbsR (MarR family)
MKGLGMFIFVGRDVGGFLFLMGGMKNRYMTNQNYLDAITKQSQEKFNRMKEKMLEPIKQVQKARQESLRSLLTEIEKKQSTLQEKKISLEKLCQK